MEQSEGEEAHRLEATEMGDYSRDNSISACPDGDVPDRIGRQHEDHFFSFLIPVKTFWRRQISVIVAHDACRDHLGTYMFLLCFTLLRSPNVG